jgi:ComF family protein
MLVKDTVKSLFHLFFPHHCCGCGSDIVSNEQVLCLSCIERLPVTHFAGHADNPVEKIFAGRLLINSAASYLYFTKDSLLQQLVHQLKYKNNRAIGLYLGRRMGETIKASNRFTTIDALVPLPLFAARERKRGYNQAAVLCEGIAAILQVPVLHHVIARHMATATQTKKTRIERWENIAGKFRLLQPDAIQHKHILLVDDVITTGATIESCGQALLSAGDVALSLFTMAYTTR